MNESENNKDQNVEASSSSQESGFEEKENSEDQKLGLGAIVAIIIIILAGAGFYFFGNDSEVSQYSDDNFNLKVRLGWLHQGQFAGFYMAQKKGFYNEAGLNVELLELDLEKNQVDEIRDGNVHASVMEAHQALVGIDGGVDLMAVMAIFQINPHVLAARKDSGINGPEDFDNKVIGLSGGEGEGNALFKIFIEKFGNEETVTYKNLGFDTVNDFVENNADIIDIYSIDQPFLANEFGIELNIIPLNAYGFSTYGDVVVFERSFVEENPEIVSRFVEATQRGWELSLEDTEEAVKVTLPFTSGNYNNKNYQRHIIRQGSPLVRGSQADIGRMDLTSWSTLYQSMKSAGVLTKDFDVSEIFTNEFIK